MQDLNVINRQNRESHAESITKWRAAGQHVVTIYEGVHLVSAVPYDTFTEAEASKAASTEHNTGRTVELLLPTALAPSEDRKAPYDRGTARARVMRDQSEDYVKPRSLEELAALGRRSVGDPA